MEELNRRKVTSDGAPLREIEKAGVLSKLMAKQLYAYPDLWNFTYTKIRNST
jgi:hypothetical protein